MIEALFLDDGELISAGVDGYIRVSPCLITTINSWRCSGVGL